MRLVGVLLAVVALGLPGLTSTAAPADGPNVTAPAAPAPQLEYAFTVKVTLAAPVELGEQASGRRRFIAITGGAVYGPMLQGSVLAAGGDWQTIMAGGKAAIEARYFLKAADGTVIEITNPGVRVASAAVTEQLAKGEEVDPSAYYFRTTPQFAVRAGPHDWLTRSVFVARGIRKPDHVLMDFYILR